MNWVVTYRSFGHGICYGLVEVAPQSTLTASYGYDEIGHWSREHPKGDLVSQTKLTYDPCHPRTP